MAENTKIEWADHTHNFWLGCERISPACDHCYAAGWAKRAGRAHLWDGERERTKDWSGPAKWQKQAVAQGRRFKVFPNSLSDFFDNQADPKWRTDAWGVIRQTPNLDWLILTKRPQNIVKFLPPAWSRENFPNVWLGTTAETQKHFYQRWAYLRDVRAAVRFISYEPALGPLSIEEDDAPDWIICGGEDFERPGRVIDLAWARSLRDECKQTGTAFFMKQVSKHKPIPADLMVREFPNPPSPIPQACEGGL